MVDLKEELRMFEAVVSYKDLKIHNVKAWAVNEQDAREVLISYVSNVAEMMNMDPPSDGDVGIVFSRR